MSFHLKREFPTGLFTVSHDKFQRLKNCHRVRRVYRLASVSLWSSKTSNAYIIQDRGCSTTLKKYTTQFIQRDCRHEVTAWFYVRCGQSVTRARFFCCSRRRRHFRWPYWSRPSTKPLIVVVGGRRPFPAAFPPRSSRCRRGCVRWNQSNDLVSSEPPFGKDLTPKLALFLSHYLEGRCKELN